MENLRRQMPGLKAVRWIAQILTRKDWVGVFFWLDSATCGSKGFENTLTALLSLPFVAAETDKIYPSTTVMYLAPCSLASMSVYVIKRIRILDSSEVDFSHV